MRFFKFLFSGTLMGVLLLVFAISIGYATIIENNFDATTAKMLIYNARWFEALMLLMVVNFGGMIFTRQLYRKSKLNVLLIHVALVIIIIGAAITRYIGFEGQMRIREGQTTDKYLSADCYFNVFVEKGDRKENESQRIWLTPANKNIFNEEVQLEGASFQVTAEQYLPNAVQSLVDDPQGLPIVQIFSLGPTGRNDVFLRWGSSSNLAGVGISFGDTTNQSHIQLIIKSGSLWIRPAIHLAKSESGESGNLPYAFTQVQPKQILQFSGINMMINDFKEKANIKYVEGNTEENGRRLMKVNVKGPQGNANVLLRYGEWNQISMDGCMISLKFGNQTWQLPFSLRLNDFLLERYPGSMSPSSFASEVTVVDEKKGVEMPYRIFMNNILDYGGFRFYQSSYDNDEKGTVLSVNHDYMGTVVTYIGYFLLFATLIISFFTKKTRFRRVSQQIKEVHEKRKKIVIPVVLAMLSLNSLSVAAQSANQIDKAHAAQFGKLIIQNKDGRMVPVNSISNQVLVKIFKKNKYVGLTADQVFLGMIVNRSYWQKQPMIKVSDEALQSMLGINGNYASFFDCFDQQGQYKLKRSVDEAYAKKPALRNMFDKELIYVDERVNVSFMAYNGSLLKILPITNDPNNHWESPMDMHDHGRTDNGNQGLIIFENYVNELSAAMVSGNYAAADQALEELKNYQTRVGKALIPSDSKVNLEVLYNNVSIFKALFPLFMTLGVVLFGFLFVQIFNPALQFRLIIKILVGILMIAFAAQTFGLGLRWYISGHAPWSNGYESMIYISWATMLAGFMFMKRSPIILSVTSLLTGVTLLTAHMSWLNPEITNLVPVLKSYWLTIHVATITASYGFFGLSFLTGFLNLCIMILRNKKNKDRINLVLKELTLIIELSLAIGLVLLVIGNFLGGIWANESWGRYWGWDPKETWSLVTIIFYSFVLHMRLIPGLRSTFSFNFFAMFGISTVLMTYFGVNYYLSGLHSYASGDPVPVPSFVYYTLGIMAVVSILAAINDVRLKDQSPVLDEAEES
jgi:cytochrome c-type biogenesis protein CcsB